jgi:phage baseplate assembly protein W
MSYSLLLENGDLVMRGTSFGIVYGVDKLTQDLTVWLTESFGSDIMHPEMGSLLDSWIGTIITAATKADIQSEVLRVLHNYQSVQVRGIKTRPQKYSLSEILYNIDDIKVTTDFDAVSVVIAASTPPPDSQVANFIIKSSANYKGA